MTKVGADAHPVLCVYTAALFQCDVFVSQVQMCPVCEQKQQCASLITAGIELLIVQAFGPFSSLNTSFYVTDKSTKHFRFCQEEKTKIGHNRENKLTCTGPAQLQLQWGFG